MPQKKIARLTRFCNRDDVERFLKLAFAVQPVGKHDNVRRLGIFPIGNCAGDERVALGRIMMGEQIEREKFVLCLCQRMIFECASKIGNVVRGCGIARFSRNGKSVLRQNDQRVERGGGFSFGYFFQTRDRVCFLGLVIASQREL